MELLLCLLLCYTQKSVTNAGSWNCLYVLYHYRQVTVPRLSVSFENPHWLKWSLQVTVFCPPMILSKILTGYEPLPPLPPSPCLLRQSVGELYLIRDRIIPLFFLHLLLAEDITLEWENHWLEADWAWLLVHGAYVWREEVLYEEALHAGHLLRINEEKCVPACSRCRSSCHIENHTAYLWIHIYFLFMETVNMHRK